MIPYFEIEYTQYSLVTKPADKCATMGEAYKPIEKIKVEDNDEWCSGDYFIAKLDFAIAAPAHHGQVGSHTIRAGTALQLKKIYLHDSGELDDTLYVLFEERCGMMHYIQHPIVESRLRHQVSAQDIKDAEEQPFNRFDLELE